MFGLNKNQENVQDEKGNQSNELTEIKNTVGHLSQMVSQLATGLQNSQNQVSRLLENGVPQPVQEDIHKTKSFSEYTQEELEEMDLKDVLDLQKIELENGFDDKMKSALKPFEDQLSSISNSNKKKSLEEQISKMTHEHPDFNDWSNEMLEINKQYEGLDLKDLYTLAKTRNPDKEKKINEKFNPKPKREHQPFGGLQPSSLMTTSAKSGGLSVHEAADKAIKNFLNNGGSLDFSASDSSVQDSPS